MENDSRRQFLFRSATGLGGAWLNMQWPAILAAQNHAREAANSHTVLVFQFFSPEQAAEVEAAAAQIIPADDTPGAREARVIYFIDRALVTFDKDKQPAYLLGLRELQVKTLELFPLAKSFSVDLTTTDRGSACHREDGLLRTAAPPHDRGFLCTPRIRREPQPGWVEADRVGGQNDLRTSFWLLRRGI